MKPEKRLVLLNTVVGIFAGILSWYVAKISSAAFGIVLAGFILALLHIFVRKKLGAQKTSIWLYAFVWLIVWIFLFNI